MRAAGVVAALGFALLGLGTSGEATGRRFVASDRGGFEARSPGYRATVGSDGAIAVGASASGAGVELRTAALGRAAASEVSSRAPVLEADGAVAIDRGVAVERLRADPTGVEQSFAFAERPAGSGDLTVRLAVRRGAPGGGSRHDVRLAAADGEALRYGHAVWVDAAGTRTDLAPRFEGDEIVVRVAAAVIDGSAYPAVLDPTLGPEVDVAPGRTLPWAGLAPAIAAGDGGYLAAWQAESAGVDGIVAVRLDDGGALRDPAYFPVSHDANDRSASVTWDGKRFLVGYASGGAGHHPLASVVNGTTVAPPLDLDPMVGGVVNVLTAPVSDRFAALWSTSSEAKGARFVTDAGVLAAPFPGVPREVITGFSGSRLAMYVGYYENAPMVVRVNLAGVSSAPVAVSSSTETTGPLIAAKTNAALAVWFDRGASEVRGSVLTSAMGVVSAGPEFDIVHATDPQISVAAGGTQFWVTVLDTIPGSPELVVMSVVDTTATFVDLIELDGPGTGLATACDTAGCVALFSKEDRTISKFRFAAHDATDDQEPVPIGNSAMTTDNASIASNGEGYLVAFDARSADTVEVGGAFLSRAGESAGYLPLTDEFNGSPSLAVQGKSYWLFGDAFEHDTVQVIPEKKGDPHPFLQLPTAGFDIEPASPDVACGADTCLLVDSDEAGLTGVSFDASGLRRKLGKLGPTAPGHVAFGAGVYAVSFAAGSRAFVTIVDLQGSTPKIGAATTIQGAFPERAPLVTFDGQNFVVAWIEPSSNGATKVGGARVDPRGEQLGDVVEFTRSSRAVIHVAPLADGATSVVSWTEPGPPTHACVARYADGKVIDVEPICIDDTGVDATTAWATAAATPGQAVLAYERQDSRTHFQTSRVKVRTLDFGDGPGAKCTASATGDTGPTCSTSFCSDGVCCDAPCDEPCRGCGADGHCAIIVSKPDPGRCDGDRSCSAEGFCLGGPGAQCDKNEQCLLGHCVGPEGDGTCCNQACGSCQRCNAAGACEAISSGGCVATCTSSADCASGMLCNDQGRCETPPPDPTSFSDCAVSMAGEEHSRSVGGAAILGFAATLLGLRRRRSSRGAPS